MFHLPFNVFRIFSQISDNVSNIYHKNVPTKFQSHCLIWENERDGNNFIIAKIEEIFLFFFSENSSSDTYNRYDYETSHTDAGGENWNEQDSRGSSSKSSRRNATSLQRPVLVIQTKDRKHKKRRIWWRREEGKGKRKKLSIDEYWSELLQKHLF